MFEADLDVNNVNHHLSSQGRPAEMALRDFLRATQNRQDDHLQHLAEPWTEQLVNEVERELLTACADVVTHWDEFDNYHNFGWSSQLNIARTSPTTPPVLSVPV